MRTMQVAKRICLAVAATATVLTYGVANGATWDELLAAGRKEGSVAVIGPVNPSVRRVLSEEFTKDTGIQVSYEGLEPNVIVSRVEREAAAGRVSVDVLVGGSAEIRTLYPKGLLAPIKPVLVLPEVTDPSRWADGKLEFTDKEGEFLLRTVSSVYGGLVINTKNVNPDAIKTAQDLLKPQWKGKVVSSPFAVGSGSGFASNVLYRMKPDYFKQLYKSQEVAFVANSRAVVEQVARGSYLVGVGFFPHEVEEFRKAGFPLEVIYLEDLPGYLSASNGTLKLMKNSPHPNAAAVFVNWYAARRAQELLMKVTLDSSRRTDVDSSLIPSYMLPKRGVNYLDQHQYEFYVDYRPKVLKQVEELLGR